jgi:hypothetical protein
MGYSVGDKVEVKPKGVVRELVDGILTKLTWHLWLLEILPRNQKLKFFRENPDAIFWRAKFTRASHSTVIEERWISRKISSNFEGFYPNKSLNSDPQGQKPSRSG